LEHVGTPAMNFITHVGTLKAFHEDLNRSNKNESINTLHVNDIYNDLLERWSVGAKKTSTVIENYFYEN
jgi:hypothetical protein